MGRTIVGTPLSQLLRQERALEEAVREHWELLDREAACWRMYGYTVEFVMDEIILQQVG